MKRVSCLEFKVGGGPTSCFHHSKTASRTSTFSVNEGRPKKSSIYDNRPIYLVVGYHGLKEERESYFILFFNY